MTTPSQSRQQARRVRVLACEGCRTRRTRCDGRKPICGTCEARECPCSYPEENKRTAPTTSVEDELSQIRSQLDRIEDAVTTRPPQRSHVSTAHADGATPPTRLTRPLDTSPSIYPGNPSSNSTSPRQTTGIALAAQNFPYMKLQTGAFTQMAGLGHDYGNMVIRLEQEAPQVTTAASPLFMLQHEKVVAALQSFSERVHPWYPFLEDRFSECISASVSNSFKGGTDAFLVLIVLASGTVTQEPSHRVALEKRPDAMYLNVAMEMLHLVVLEQSLRSVQCLVAASIHYYLLLRPTQAHDLVVLAIKKAQNLHLSGSLQNDQSRLEHWVRVYRIALLIEGELVVPIQLADSRAWETEEEIPLPTGTNIWSFESEETPAPVETPQSNRSARSDDLITYLLAEVAMRRMLRRNTTAITVSGDHCDEYSYAPLVANELEAQLDQWFSFLPEPLRFSREVAELHHDASFQTPFLRTQYWACMVSFYWPAVVQVMETQHADETEIKGCTIYFHSYREFIKSATSTLDVCLPNKWTIYASIFAITLGAYLGASNALLSQLAGGETWDMIRLARDSFGDECFYSPSLSVMADSLRVTLFSIRDT